MVQFVELEPDDVLVIGHFEPNEHDVGLFERLRDVLGVALIVTLPGPVDLAAVRQHLNTQSGGAADGPDTG